MCLNECKWFSFRSLSLYSIVKSYKKLFKLWTLVISTTKNIYFGAYLEKLPFKTSINSWRHIFTTKSSHVLYLTKGFRVRRFTCVVNLFLLVVLHVFHFKHSLVTTCNSYLCFFLVIRFQMDAENGIFLEKLIFWF